MAGRALILRRAAGGPRIAARLRGFAAALACASACAHAQAPSAPPATYADAHVDVFHGRRIADPYRWLEDTRAPWTRAWFEAQNAYARATLDALPERRALRAEIADLMAAVPVVVDAKWGGERLFALERDAGSAVYRLTVRQGTDGPARVVVDPARHRTDAEPASIEYYAPSPNGRLVAYAVSLAGSEAATLRVVDVDTGLEVGAAVTRADFGALDWRFDSTVLYYLRHREPPPGSPPADRYKDASVWMRTFVPTGVGPDVPVLGRTVGGGLDLAPDDAPAVMVSPVSSYALGVIRHGVAREISVYAAPLTALRGPATPWRKIVDRSQGVEEVALRGEWLYLRTHDGAPRYRLLRHSLRGSAPLDLAAAETVLAETDAVLTGFAVAKDAIYVVHSDAGVGRVERLEFNVKLVNAPRAPRTVRGKPKPPAALPKVAGVARTTPIALPFAGSVQEVVADPLRPGTLVRLAGWTRAPGYYSVAPRTGALTRTPIQPASPVDLSGASVAMHRVPARDGTLVPLTLIAPRDLPRDGRAPVIVEAYGAYGYALEPRFRPQLKAWLDRGGVYAIAHARGGGELGKPWHEAGRLANKPATWLDVVDCVDWLVGRGHAAAGRVALRGGSAGALAVVNAMIARPDLARAVVSEVGFHDTLRGEFAASGPANVEEFGSVAAPDGLRRLLAMSPYASARDGVAYPAVLFTAGYNDPRVEPWDPGKMAARLQAIAGGPGGGRQPVLLRLDFAGGHGGTTLDARIDEETDVAAFALWRLRAPDGAAR